MGDVLNILFEDDSGLSDEDISEDDDEITSMVILVGEGSVPQSP